MAKLYAEITSDKGGRIASKSGDVGLQVTLKIKNSVYAKIWFYDDGQIDIVNHKNEVVKSFDFLALDHK